MTTVRHWGAAAATTPFPTLERRSIAVNTFTRQIAVGDEAAGSVGTPLPLIALRYFDARASYVLNDLVVQNGIQYKAKGSISAGAFNASQWDVADSSGSVLRAGDTMTGDLTISHAGINTFTINPTDGTHAILRGRDNGKDRWNMFLGNGTAPGGDFVLQRCDNAGAVIDAPFYIPRSTGIPQFTSLLVSSAGQDSTLRLNHPAATGYNYLIGSRGNSSRWTVILGDGQAETGSNTGSDFQIQRYSDAGSGNGTVMHIRRDNANVSLTGGITFTADATVFNGAYSIARHSAGYLLLNGGSAGYVFNNTSNGATLVTIANTGEVAIRSGTSGLPSNNIALKISFPGGGTLYGLRVRTATDGTNALIFFNASDVGVGSIGITSTATTFNTASDERLKEDLQSFDAGHIVDDTEVYNFAWKSTGERSYGVIAQQANTVYPSAVSYAEQTDGWFIDYSKYVPVMLQELKALRGRVMELETAAGLRPTPPEAKPGRKSK